MAAESASPPTSPSSSPTSRSTKTDLSLDLSNLPPLIEPSPPSNTLLITNLLDPQIFHPASLTEIRTFISTHTPLHSFSPLRSLRRIIVSFPTTPAAVAIRQLLDGAPIMGCPARIYFGEPTPINPEDQHLQAPKSQKLFFISPPPSPPFGWEVREEGAPNKEVHAGDLVAALAKLHARYDEQPLSPIEDGGAENVRTGDGGEREGKRIPGAGAVGGRQRSGSTTVVYHPRDHGDSPHLPAVMVEDTTEEEDVSPIEGGVGTTKTARPPVELME